MAVEIVGALFTSSLVLLADAGHVLIDVTGMSLTLLAVWFGGRSPTAEKSYGYYRLEILAALLNGVLMVAIGAYISVEAVRRFLTPPELPGLSVLAFGVPGLAVNLVAGFLLFEGQQRSLNLRAAFLEVLSDLLGSAAIILSGAILLATGFKLIDPIASLAIGLFILPRTWKLLSESMHVLLEGAPAEINVGHVREHILSAMGVIDVHDLHVWNLTSGMNVISAHVVVGPEVAPQTVLDELASCLASHFDIEHSTFQIEQPTRRETERASH